MLVSWYYQQGDLDGAETLLRKLAGADDGPTDGHATLIRFLAQARGPEAAAAETDRLVAATEGLPQQALYRGLRARHALRGRRRTMRRSPRCAKILDGAEASDQTRRLKLTLARMLIATGDQVGARELVEAVLGEDPGQVDALKMRAAWLIREDKPDAAIVDLRTALNNAPRDVDILMLMAEAHLRAGQRELAGERLALAVEVSNSAPQVALRYADFLLQDGRTQPAEAVLLAARKLNPDSLPVLQKLADLWLTQQDWPRLQGLVADLRGIDTTDASTLAGNLQAAIMLGQNRTEEGLSHARRASSQAGDDRALALTVMTRLRDGETDKARTLVAEALDKRPDEPGLRLLSAVVDAAAGDTDKAETTLRALVAERPHGRGAGADAVLAADRHRPRRGGGGGARRRHRRAAEIGGAAAGPRRALRGRQGLRRGDRDLREDVCRRQLERDRRQQPGQPARRPPRRCRGARTRLRHRPPPARAAGAGLPGHAMAGSNIAAATTTRRWRRSSRRPRASPNNALVQAHLGLTYVALGRDADARPHLERALELAGDDPLPQFAEVRTALERIRKGAAGETKPADN